MSTRHDQASRRRIVEQWKKSGLPAREFADRADVSAWTLYKWRRELRHEATGFVEIVADESAASVQPVHSELDPALEVALPGGTVVRVGRGVSEAWLRRVVLALAGSPA